MRMYQKFDVQLLREGVEPQWHPLVSEISLSRRTIPPADGTGFFHVPAAKQLSAQAGESPPGFTELYVYWPKQRSGWGDHWYPDGTVIPWIPASETRAIGLFTRPNIQILSRYPQFIPQLDRWYCYELMVKANTPGKNDGEVKFWIDGKVAGDFPNLNMRSISTLKIDHAIIPLHATTPNATSRSGMTTLSSRQAISARWH